MTETYTNGSHHEYWKDIEDYAATALDADHWSKDTDIHDRVHELVDGSEWVIYDWRHSKVLDHTDHFDAYDDFGSGRETTLRETLRASAYFAMVADVEDRISRWKRSCTAWLHE